MFIPVDPNQERVHAFLREQYRNRFSYPGPGTSASSGAPPGFDLDHNRACIGRGEEDFRAAVAAVRAWVMFPRPWTRVEPADARIAQGIVVAMVARAYGLWWINTCRIVYVVDEVSPVRRFGFAYGTLPGHVESGEVWYDLRAFSRPHYWLVRLFKPLARRLQARFVIESQEAMRRAVEAARVG
jgi:uncharacterized protein (UPF0548 family)